MHEEVYAFLNNMVIEMVFLLFFLVHPVIHEITINIKSIFSHSIFFFFKRQTFGNSTLSLNRSTISGFRFRSNSLDALRIIIAPKRRKKTKSIESFILLFGILRFSYTSKKNFLRGLTDKMKTKSSLYTVR